MSDRWTRAAEETLRALEAQVQDGQRLTPYDLGSLSALDRLVDPAGRIRIDALLARNSRLGEAK